MNSLVVDLRFPYAEMDIFSIWRILNDLFLHLFRGSNISQIIFLLKIYTIFSLVVRYFVTCWRISICVCLT